MTAVYDEPLLPPPGEPATSRDEYRITYRDPGSGEEYVILSDRATWLEKRNGLQKMGFPVVVEKRQVRISAWERVEERNRLAHEARMDTARSNPQAVSAADRLTERLVAENRGAA